MHEEKRVGELSTQIMVTPQNIALNLPHTDLNYRAGSLWQRKVFFRVVPMVPFRSGTPLIVLNF